MNLRHIEAFYAIVTEGSINAAAARLNVSQPALSRTLKHAETSLGFRLFDRVRQRLVPTQEAELLFGEATDVHVALERFQSLARNLGRNPQENLRVGFLPSLGDGLTPKLLARLPANWREVRLEIFTHHYDALMEKLYRFDLDICVAYRLGTWPGVSASALGTMKHVYIEPAGRPPRDPARKIRLEDLDMDDFIGFERNSPIGRIIANSFEARASRYEPRVTVHTYSVATACVREGLGCAIVDEYSASLTKGLTIYPLENPVPLVIASLRADKRPMSNAEATFARILRKTCTALARPGG